MHHAHGNFDVKLAPLAAHETTGAIGRRSIDKTFHGDMQGTSVGEMVMAMGSMKGSAGYVAMERIVGVLKGRAGSFVLQHSSTMNRRVPTQSITVVPDSGTEALVGLRGSLVISIADGVHSYAFDYEFG
jgi:Protein of unknown function (DUF3224)